MKTKNLLLFFFLFHFFLTSFAQSIEDLRNENDPVNQLISTGQFDSALVVVNTLLEKDSLSFQHHIHQFEIFRNKGRKRSLLRKAKENYELFFDAVGEKEKIILLLQYAHASFRRKKYDDFQDLLKRASQKLDQNFESNENLKNDKGWKYVIGYYYLVEGIGHSHFFGMADERVESFFLKALQTFQELKTPDPYLQANTAKRLGIRYRVEADFEKSLNYFQKEIDTYQQANFAPTQYDLGGAFYNKANIYYELADFQSALNHYLKAYESWRHHLKTSDTYMRYLTETIGEMYWELGQKEKALPFFNLSVEGKEVASNPDLEKPKIADSLLAQNRYQEAMDIYEDALEFRMKLYGAKHGLTGACQNFIAKAWLTKGEPEKALDAYQQALIMLVTDFEDSLVTTNPDLSMQIISEQYLLETLAGKTMVVSELYRKSGRREDLELAFETAQKSIELLNRLRQSPLADRSRMFWTQKYFPLFETALELAFDLFPDSEEFSNLSVGQAGKIFSIMEESKTMLLQNATRTEQELEFLNVPKTILEEERELRKAINQYAVRIENEERLCDKAQADKLELWNKELLSQKLNYDIFLEKIKQDFPDFYDLKFAGGVLDISEVQSQLLANGKTALIEFFEGEKYIYTLLLTRNKTFHFRTKNDRVFQEHLQAFIESLYDVENSLKQPKIHFRNFTQQSFYIFEKLMQPILEKLPESVEHLYLIPDHHLFYLPFESLITKEIPAAENDFRKLPYLMNRFFISYSQSASMLSLSNFSNKKSFKYDYVGFAPDQFTDQLTRLNSLDWNRKEVTTVAKKWNGKPFNNHAATKNQFIQLAGMSQVQHLATHALLDNENPMQSKILFQKNENEEGILNTYELYALPLAAELVVLNACNTSVGKWERGEGMMSLERAFQYAGCPSLLTSTWSIDDQATAELTTYFFDFLQEGKPKDEALTLAKRKFLEKADPALGHPFFWAGLRLTGNSDAISLKPAKGYWYWWLGGIIGFSLVFFIRKKRNVGLAD